ncbi:MAG: hypothetical protein ACKOGA_13475 [Planctomycetaceae bacterium]
MLLVETPRPGDRIELTTDPQARVVLAVHSERGIGSAIITRQVPTWPHELVVRWHLRGLESFELTTAQGRLSGAVTTTSPGSPPGAGGPAQPQATARATPAAHVAARLRFRLWRDAHEESLLQPGDPWFGTAGVPAGRKFAGVWRKGGSREEGSDRPIPCQRSQWRAACGICDQRVARRRAGRRPSGWGWAPVGTGLL